MSHELTKNRLTKKIEMAYVGETPWHGLGQALTADASIDTWKKESGMDWEAKRSRVRFGEGPAQRIWDANHVIYRGDTKEPLGIVSKNYKIVQPGECLEFFRSLTEGAGFKLETAGTMFGGRRYWALARVTEDAVVVGQDRVGGYLMLASSCDGSLATQGRFTAIRVVCNNTMTAALGEGKAHAKVSHRSVFSVDDMKDKLGIARDTFAEFMVQARALTKVKMTDAGAEDFLKKLFVEQKLTKKIETVHELPGFQKILGLFKGSAMGGTLTGTAGTGWGVLNAVTEYVDHHAKADSVNNRLFNAWWGNGEKLKNAAFSQALALV